jgi:ELWxxDGT repeat protein
MARANGLRGAAAVTAAALICGSIVAGVAAGAQGDATATRVADIEPGNPGSAPAELTDAGAGILLFSATTSGDGTELWKSNGGPLGAGTEVVEEIAGGAGGSNPSDFADAGETVLFAANDGVDGKELWKTAPPYDEASTEQVENIAPAGSGSSPEHLVNAGGTVIFAADDDATSGLEPWKSEPPYDADSTELLADVDPIASSSPDEFTVAGDSVFFTASNAASGQEVWVTSPPFTSASVVEEIVTDPGQGSTPHGLTAVGDTLFFAANDGVSGEELWKTAPPYDSAGRVEDIGPGAADGEPRELANVGGSLYFSADNDANGDELWRSAPPFIDASTSLVADINPGASSPSNPSEITDFGGIAYFRASDGTTGAELWRSDGGPLNAGTDLAADILPGGPPGSGPAELTVSNGTLFFRATGDAGQELWKTNAAGTAQVADINPGTAASLPQLMTDVGGTLYFRALENASGIELYKATVAGPDPPAQQPPPVATPVKKKKCKPKKKKGKKSAAAAKKKKKKCKKKKKKK